MIEYLPLILFGIIFLLILFGYPVAFTLGGISILVGLFVFDSDFFYLLSLRIYGTMQNFVLLAVPLFIFMGMMLEKSGIAERLLHTCSDVGAVEHRDDRCIEHPDDHLGRTRSWPGAPSRLVAATSWPAKADLAGLARGQARRYPRACPPFFPSSWRRPELPANGPAFCGR